MFTDQLKTVRWSDSSHPNDVVELNLTVQPSHFPQQLYNQKGKHFANEINHEYSPVDIVVLDPRYD